MRPIEFNEASFGIRSWLASLYLLSPDEIDESTEESVLCIGTRHHSWTRELAMSCGRGLRFPHGFRKVSAWDASWCCSENKMEGILVCSSHNMRQTWLLFASLPPLTLTLSCITMPTSKLQSIKDRVKRLRSRSPSRAVPRTSKLQSIKKLFKCSSSRSASRATSPKRGAIANPASLPLDANPASTSHFFLLRSIKADWGKGNENSLTVSISPFNATTNLNPSMPSDGTNPITSSVSSLSPRHTNVDWGKVMRVVLLHRHQFRVRSLPIHPLLRLAPYSKLTVCLALIFDEIDHDQIQSLIHLLPWVTWYQKLTVCLALLRWDWCNLTNAKVARRRKKAWDWRYMGWCSYQRRSSYFWMALLSRCRYLWWMFW